MAADGVQTGDERVRSNLKFGLAMEFEQAVGKQVGEACLWTE
jgi:hypothetical protein